MWGFNWNAGGVQPSDEITFFQGSDELTHKSRLFWPVLYSASPLDSFLAVKSQNAKIRKQRETMLGKSPRSPPCLQPCLSQRAAILSSLSCTTFLPLCCPMQSEKKENNQTVICNYGVRQWRLCIVLHSGGPFQLMHVSSFFFLLTCPDSLQRRAAANRVLTCN